MGNGGLSFITMKIRLEKKTCSALQTHQQWRNDSPGLRTRPQHAVGS